MEIHVENSLAGQIEALSKLTGRAPGDLVQEALTSYFEEVQDALRAIEISQRDERLWTQEEVERDLGFSN